MSSTTPSHFVTRTTRWLTTYEATVEQIDGEWLQSVTISRPLLPDTEYARRPITADHAAHMYREYDVIEEVGGLDGVEDGCGCAEVWEYLSERREADADDA